MRLVADFLSKEAYSRKREDEVDVFGRSAFNRYYYATFWIVRSMLVLIDSDWSNIPHKALPEVVESALLKRIRAQVQKLANPKSLIISISEANRIKAIANGSAAELAKILRQGYRSRVMADYRLEARVVKGGQTLVLWGDDGDVLEVKLSEAANWPKKADQHVNILLRICNEIGII